MAIEIQPGAGRMQPVSGGPESARPWWMRPAVHTGIIGAIIGYFLGHWLGNLLSSSYAQNSLSDSNDFPVILGYVLGTVGWLAGLGVFNDLGRLMIGKPMRDVEHAPAGGLAKYFRYTLDHKVVGIQYLFGMITYFLTGGLFAMAIRSELLSPTYHLMSSSAYLMVVGEHGTMMMMMMSSVVLGPFGQYFAPLMIGSKRMAFPRIEAIGFWLTPAAYIILLSGVLLQGFPSGWTGYAPLSIQAGPGMDTYFVAFGLMGISMILAGFNIIVTYINYRAPGMRWSRLPMFVWSMFTVSFLQVLAVPVLVAGLYMLITDRTVQTAFFVNQLGGSSYLYQNVFWFFGHPEVYILALPGFGVVFEILPVFSRKPLFGYKVAAAGMIGGVTGVFVSDVPADTTAHGSFFVMAHFHYTIMGGLIFAFFGACYYWLPKIMGIKLNQTLGKWHFWTMFIFFNSTFLPLFGIGMAGQPRRVFEYARSLETANDWVSISSFFLGGSILIFVINFVWSTVIARVREEGNPWQSRGLEWQVSSPPPPSNFAHVPVVLSGPYEYGTPGAPPVADLNPPTGVISAAFAGDQTARAEA